MDIESSSRSVLCTCYKLLTGRRCWGISLRPSLIRLVQVGNCFTADMLFFMLSPTRFGLIDLSFRLNWFPPCINWIGDDSELGGIYFWWFLRNSQISHVFWILRKLVTLLFQDIYLLQTMDSNQHMFFLKGGGCFCFLWVLGYFSEHVYQSRQGLKVSRCSSSHVLFLLSENVEVFCGCRI